MARIVRILLGALLCAGTALATSSSSAAADGLNDVRADAGARLVETLAEVADWCQSKRLYRSRDAVYETLLHFEPDHRDARRMLRYKKQKNGGWARRRYQEPKDRGDGALLEDYETRRAAAAEAFRAAVLDYLDALDDELPAAALERVWSDFLAIDPDDERARAARGEARDPVRDLWVLQESVASAGRRSALADAALRFEAEAPDPVAEELRRLERELALDGVAVLRVGNVRICGTGQPDVLTDCAASALTAQRLFDVACGRDGRISSHGMTIFLLETDQERQSFLASYPGLTDAQRTHASSLSSFWVPGTTELVIGHTEHRVLLDQTIRQAVSHMLHQRYGITPRQGWVFEGMGSRLTEMLLGRVQTLASAGLPEDVGDLWTQAQGLGDASRPSGLRYVLDKPAGELRGDGLLYAYALTRFLLEGHPGEVDAVLGLIGNGTPSSAALEQTLGLGPTALEERLLRWMAETS